jgi:hypothetical protein
MEKPNPKHEILNPEQMQMFKKEGKEIVSDIVSLEYLGIVQDFDIKT